MPRLLFPSLLAAALLAGCAHSPGTDRSPIPSEQASQAAIEQAIHQEVSRLLSGQGTLQAPAAASLAMTQVDVSPGDTVLSLLRQQGAPESLFYGLRDADRQRLSRLSPGDQLGLLKTPQGAYVGLAVASRSGEWYMARQDIGTYQLTKGLMLAEPSLDVVDLPLKPTLEQTLAASSLPASAQSSLLALLARGFPSEGLPATGWLRLRLEQSIIDGVTVGEPTLLSAALSADPEPSFMVRYQPQQGSVAYFNGKGERLEPDWIARPILGQYRITSEFNPQRRHPVTGRVRPHNGRDFAARSGTPVIAAMDGTVAHAGWKGSWGRLVVIRHADGVETRYAHLRSIDGLTVGERVSQGQIIGGVGTSGLSTGPHLHFEVYMRGLPQDPAKFDPGRATYMADARLTESDRLWLERYRTLEIASLAQQNPARTPARFRAGRKAGSALALLGD